MKQEHHKKREKQEDLARDRSTVIHPFIHCHMKTFFSIYCVPGSRLGLVNTKMTIPPEAYKDLRV